MSEWGRKEYTGWPSRAPVWTCAAVFGWLLIFASGMVYQYAQRWSFAEREYLGNYMKASTLGRLWDDNYYRLLVCIDKKGHLCLAKLPSGYKTGLMYELRCQNCNGF